MIWTRLNKLCLCCVMAYKFDRPVYDRDLIVINIRTQRLCFR